MISRRAFAVFTASVLVPVAAFAQSRDGVRRVGVLMPNSAADPSMQHRAPRLSKDLPRLVGEKETIFGSSGVGPLAIRYCSSAMRENWSALAPKSSLPAEVSPPSGYKATPKRFRSSLCMSPIQSDRGLLAAWCVRAATLLASRFTTRRWRANGWNC